MMRIFLTLPLMGLLLTACSTLSVKSDYDPDHDYSKIRTYAWLEGQKHSDDTRINNTLIINRINNAIKTELATRGLKESGGEQPDIYINWFGGIENKIRQETINQYYGSMWYGHPYGGYWPGYSQTYNVEYQEGTLIIDILDGKTRDLIWRGTGQDYVEDNQKPEEITKGINEAVKQIMAAVPPTPKKK
jgi:hypothetical protein